MRLAPRLRLLSVLAVAIGLGIVVTPLAGVAGATPDGVVGVEFEGMIEALDPPTLTVAGRTVMTTAETRIHRGEAAIELSALQVGELVRVHGALQADGSVVASEIEVAPPERPHDVEFVGELQKIDGNALSVGGIPVTVSDETAIRRGDERIRLEDLHVGDRLLVKGTLRSDGTVAATAIIVLFFEPELFTLSGPITAISYEQNALAVGEVTIVADERTVIDGFGEPHSFADLRVGDRVVVRAVRRAGAPPLALAIHRLPPRPVLLRGPIVAIALDRNAFTLTDVTIAVDEHTVFGGAGDPKSLADLHVGDFVVVKATRRADGSVLARAVHRLPPPPPPRVELRGPIVAIALEDSAFTLGAATIAVDAQTTFAGDGNPQSLADLHVGDFVVVKATSRADGSLLALAVHRVPPPPPERFRVRGTIEAVGSDGVTVDGKLFAVDRDTIVRIGGHAATLADLRLRQTAVVHAILRPDGTALATTIRIVPGRHH